MDNTDYNAYVYYVNVELLHDLAMVEQSQIDLNRTLSEADPDLPPIDSSAHQKQKDDYMGLYLDNMKLTMQDPFKRQQYQLGKLMSGTVTEARGKKRGRAIEDDFPRKVAKTAPTFSFADTFHTPNSFKLPEAFKFDFSRKPPSIKKTRKNLGK